jgi:hypothetical protein
VTFQGKVAPVTGVGAALGRAATLVDGGLSAFVPKDK